MSLAIFATSTVLALYGPICLVNDYFGWYFQTVSNMFFPFSNPSKVGNRSWQRFVFYELLHPQQVADCGQADNERLRIEAPCCHIFFSKLAGGESLWGTGHSSMSSMILSCKIAVLSYSPTHFISSWLLQLVLWCPHSPVLCFDIRRPFGGRRGLASRGHLPTRSLSRSGCTHYHCKRAEVRGSWHMVCHWTKGNEERRLVNIWLWCYINAIYIYTV